MDSPDNFLFSFNTVRPEKRKDIFTPLDLMSLLNQFRYWEGNCFFGWVLKRQRKRHKILKLWQQSPFNCLQNPSWFLILPQMSFLFKSNVIGTISIFDDFFSIWHLHWERNSWKFIFLICYHYQCSKTIYMYKSYLI